MRSDFMTPPHQTMVQNHDLPIRPCFKVMPLSPCLENNRPRSLIQFNLSNILGFLISICIHTYITHIYQRSIKTPKTCCQVVEHTHTHKNGHGNVLFFGMPGELPLFLRAAPQWSTHQKHHPQDTSYCHLINIHMPLQFNSSLA